jgi:Flp pilus assembly pilin Flp
MPVLSFWFQCATARAQQLCADARGATAVEYGLLAAVLGLAVCTTVFTVGENVKVMLYERLIAMFVQGP